MSITGGQGVTEQPDSSATPEEIEADIARARQELGETVEALAERLDVKARTRKRMTEVSNRGRERLARARAQLSEGDHWVRPAVAAAVAAAAVVGVLLWRRR